MRQKSKINTQICFKVCPPWGWPGDVQKVTILSFLSLFFICSIPLYVVNKDFPSFSSPSSPSSSSFLLLTLASPHIWTCLIFLSIQSYIRNFLSREILILVPNHEIEINSCSCLESWKGFSSGPPPSLSASFNLSPPFPASYLRSLLSSILTPSSQPFSQF